MKKTVKKSIHKESSIREDIRRLGVIMEANNDKIDLVAEQYGDITVAIGGIKNTLNEHTQILNEHTQILEEHTEMFGKIFVDISIIKEDIEFIKTDLKKKIDVDQFAALEKRVAFLERKAV